MVESEPIIRIVTAAIVGNVAILAACAIPELVKWAVQRADHTYRAALLRHHIRHRFN